ncbi:MAG: Protein of unknown function (DUF2849) [Rhodobacteraceae bacterium HLUCCA12]|nr:MAG: Protein of unknown function (DUF2849) [Rhodobacteraceae bacterium HLUCCA12]
MSRRFTPSVITANALLSGEVVWLCADGQWSPDPRAAALFTDADLAQDRLAWAQGQAQAVVGPYLAGAKSGPDGPEPVHFREAFRRRGPSNYPHGKQEALCRG